jgi:hypothetical protein
MGPGQGQTSSCGESRGQDGHKRGRVRERTGQKRMAVCLLGQGDRDHGPKID